MSKFIIQFDRVEKMRSWVEVEAADEDEAMDKFREMDEEKSFTDNDREWEMVECELDWDGIVVEEDEEDA